MVRFWNNSECAIPIWTKIGTTKQLDTKNKPVMYFLKILKIDPTRRGQGSSKLPNFDPKSRFGLSFGFGWSDVDKNWHGEATGRWQQAFSCVFTKFANLTAHGEVKVQNLT